MVCQINDYYSSHNACIQILVLTLSSARLDKLAFCNLISSPLKPYRNTWINLKRLEQFLTVTNATYFSIIINYSLKSVLLDCSNANQVESINRQTYTLLWVMVIICIKSTENGRPGPLSSRFPSQRIVFIDLYLLSITFPRCPSKYLTKHTYLKMKNIHSAPNKCKYTQYLKDGIWYPNP